MAKKIKWNTERILGISAMGISFITLVIFIYQTNLMSKQNYLSILPYLSLSTSDNAQDNTFSLTLDNYGVGPAIIESVNLKYQGENEDLIKYDDDIFAYFRAKSSILDSIKNVSYSTLDVGLAIPAGTKYNLISINKSAKDYELFKKNLEDFLEKGFYFEIFYKSIQDEHWKISNTSQGPIKLD